MINIVYFLQFITERIDTDDDSLIYIDNSIPNHDPMDFGKIIFKT